MNENDVKSKKAKCQTFDFMDYQHSKRVLKDHPEILEILYKALYDLQEFRAYAAVWDTISVLENSIQIVELQQAYYQNINETKGQID